jgi:hypothetical protein
LHPTTIYTGPNQPNLRVVEVLESDDLDNAAILVVDEEQRKSIQLNRVSLAIRSNAL